MNIVTVREFTLKQNAIEILKTHEMTYKKNILLVAGSKTLSKNGLTDKIKTMLLENASSVNITYAPSNEPTVTDIDNITEKAKEIKPNLIVVFGGGSAIDTAKALSLLINSESTVIKYLVDKTKKPEGCVIPIIAIPTTAGTGSETTKNAVISMEEKGGIKSSIRYDILMPYMAILDPALLVSLPKKITAESGMDTLVQLIESYTSSKANVYTDNMALWGISLIKDALVKSYHNPSDIDAREKMLLSSYLSGVCLANGGLGASHGLASVLGMFGVSHGVAVALTIPHVMEMNYSHAKEKFDMLTNILCSNTKYKNAIDYIYALREELSIPSKLITDKKIDIEYIAKTANTGSMLANTYTLSIEEIECLIKKII